MSAHPKPWALQVIHGSPTSGTTSAGAFLNFAETNAYKARQVAEFSLLVQQGKVKKGDRALFADAWHPGVIHLRYMSDLLRLNLSIDVMWHAGSYDHWDFLGRAVKNKHWSFNFERSLFEAADKNYFATDFHRFLFISKIRPFSKKKARTIGWPMEYLPPLLVPLSGSARKDTILFPHRMSVEKQPVILQALQAHFPQYRFVFAQQTALTKQQYHQELARSLAVFSASRQETLGIGIFEGLLAGAVPIVPNRLSYKKMYSGWCYPSSWTLTPQAATKLSRLLISYIQQAILQRNPQKLAVLARQVGRNYFDGSKLYASILR